MAVSTPVDRLMQTIRVHVPGVPEETIKLELFNVMDEFFRRSSAWRAENEITLLADTTEYDIDTPVGATVVRALSATHNGLPVKPFDPALGLLTSGVLSYAVQEPDVLLIASAPANEQLSFPLKVVFAYSVHRDALEIDPGDWQLDDWMYDTFFNDWKNGTFAALYGMPNKPWSNPTLGVFHGRKFNQAVAQRTREARNGFVYAPVGWRYNRWA